MKATMDKTIRSGLFFQKTPGTVVPEYRERRAFVNRLAIQGGAWYANSNMNRGGNNMPGEQKESEG